MNRLIPALLLVLPACLGEVAANEYADEDPSDEPTPSGITSSATCDATMSVFPVVGDHNIGYDASCNTGTCAVSCSLERANSDYGPKANGEFHHGIDVFAHRGATLVAVADGVVDYATIDKVNGSHEVKITDRCGWSYFYGHLDTFAVSKGQLVVAGQPVGTMGNTGTGGVHLHFNASASTYSNDVDPLALLERVNATACGGTPTEVPPPPPPTPGCGKLVADETIGTYENRTTCSGSYNLVMQGDGNLVLYQAANQTPSGAAWNARVFGADHILTMQQDGNLVMYINGTTTAVWNTHTNGNPGAYLEIGEGVLRVRSASGGTLWTSH